MTTLFLASVGIVSLAIVAGTGLSQGTLDAPERAAKSAPVEIADAEIYAGESRVAVMAQATPPTRSDPETEALPARRPR